MDLLEHPLITFHHTIRDFENPRSYHLAATLDVKSAKVTDVAFLWALCSTYIAMANATMSTSVGGIPLTEFRKDTPPGWAPNLPDYPLSSYLQKLKLWYRIYDGPDESVGPLVAGRLQGQAAKLALNLRLIRPDGNYDVGDEALVRLSVDQVLDPMDPTGQTILQHAIPSGVQALAFQLREAFGLSEQELTTSALSAFFEFRRGKLSLQEYASEWELLYEEAQTKAGLEVNQVAKTYLFFRGSGLPNKFIEDVKLQIHGDLSRFQEAKRLALRLSQRGEGTQLSNDLYMENSSQDYDFDKPNTFYGEEWHDSWQADDWSTWYADDWHTDDWWNYYDDAEYEEYQMDHESWTPTGRTPSSEWHTPPEEHYIGDLDDQPPASSTDQPTEDSYYGKGNYGGCHVCGSKWHMAAQCPVKTGSTPYGERKGKGKSKSKKGPWRPKGKGKGKGYGKGKKGKSFRDGKGKYYEDHVYYRQQPGKGLQFDFSSPTRTTTTEQLKVTPPDHKEILPWRRPQSAEETGSEQQSSDATQEVPPLPSYSASAKTLSFATYVNNTTMQENHACYHAVRGKTRRGLLIDPGAAAGLIGSETLRDLLTSCYPELRDDQLQWMDSTATITGISGCPDKALGRIELKLPFKGMDAVYTADVIGNEGSLCPALVGNPALCAMKASLHSCWFENQDGLLVTWDSRCKDKPKMYMFRVLLTDSGHYLLPLDEDTSIPDGDTSQQTCHFLRHLSEESHRHWPDHAYTFWQQATGTTIPEQQRSTRESVADYVSTLVATSTKADKDQDRSTSCSTTAEADKNYSRPTSCSTTAEADKNYSRPTSCSTTVEASKDHDRHTSCSSTVDASKNHSTTTSCSATPEETEAEETCKKPRSKTVTFQNDALPDEVDPPPEPLEDNLMYHLQDLPLYQGDQLPEGLNDEERKKLIKDYKAMPEEFYTRTNRRMVTPSSFPTWFAAAKKRKTKWHVWEWCSGSGRLSLTCCLASLVIGFPVDYRYGWDWEIHHTRPCFVTPSTPLSPRS